MAIRNSLRERLRKFRNTDDLGFSSKAGSGYRTLSKDGTFLVERKGGEFNLYHYLIDMRWSHFILWIVVGYFFVSAMFAVIYYMIGPEHISGFSSGTILHNFSQCFYFSTQTLTTVGYGALAPKGSLTNFISSLEAVVGLLSFSLATGLFYGRFIKPRKGFMFSNVAVITPETPFKRLMVRVAYKQNNILLDLEAKFLVTLLVNENGESKRKYLPLKLDVDKVVTLPLNWTLVHEINEQSPLYDLYPQDYSDSKVELILMIKGYSEMYAQELHARSSWIADEIFWDKKFKIPYSEDSTRNKVVFDLSMLDEVEA